MKEFACSAMCNASKGLHESTTLEWFTKKKFGLKSHSKPNSWKRNLKNSFNSFFHCSFFYALYNLVSNKWSQNIRNNKS